MPKFYDPSQPVPREDEPGGFVFSEKVRHYRKAGYMVITQRMRDPKNRRNVMTIRSAVTPDGHYIGDPRRAHMLCVCV